MTRKMFTPTDKQIEKWSRFVTPEIPTDEWFKDRWARDHHGKMTGWGMGKRDWIVSNMKNTMEYQMGLWQGRVDKANGLEYSEERSYKTYNLGYYRGYCEWDPDPRNSNGMDSATYTNFIQTYVEAK